MTGRGAVADRPGWTIFCEGFQDRDFLAGVFEGIVGSAPGPAFDRAKALVSRALALDDNLGEADETLTLALASPTNATIGTASALVTFVLLGRWLEERAKGRASAAMRPDTSMMAVMPVLVARSM